MSEQQLSDIPALVLRETIAGLRATKLHAERAIAQVADDDLHRLVDPEANSIAVIMRHLAGNMRSRWTDFLTADGEKPGRNRDGEFEPSAMRRVLLVADWESGWRALFGAVESLRPDDLARLVMIRGEPHTVFAAIEGQARHYAEHVGQIVLLAKHWRGDAWKTLSIPMAKASGE